MGSISTCCTLMLLFMLTSTGVEYVSVLVEDFLTV